MKKIICLFLVLTMLLLLFASCGSVRSGNKSDAMVPEMHDSYSFTDMNESKDIYTETPQPKDRMLVYRLTYSIESMSFQEDCKLLQDKAVELGGYMESYNLYSGQSHHVRYTFRVPTQQLDVFTEMVEKTGNITKKNTQVEDYTKNFYDIQTEIDLLKTEQSYVEGFLDESQDNEERNQLIQQLLSCKREIARLEKQQSDITETVLYSSVSVEIFDVSSYSDHSVSYGSSLGDAFFSGWRGFVNVLKELLYVIVLLSPIFLMFGFIVVIAVVIIRAKKKKKVMSAEIMLHKQNQSDNKEHTHQ